ncbi:FecCD family ABC transporter permease [Cohnella thailandensis]|uniref:Iron ABC transporter permease n=1 Tax=Cohnella thailandensis TaxID=557557 RepID=A0A841SMB0_9BACL|nr:iron ABC transporter permease [Cohnella thailandensis]MBB6633064.1 iron ABC transporter permease [Cohnella thailandensis]MBP1975241.1 iron complex transport system permease protein [Cohnella thailandensis]
MSGSRKPKSFALKAVLSVAALAVVFLLAMLLGAKDVSMRELWLVLFNQGGDNDKVAMLREIRYPREVAAVLVGAALAVAGAIMQGLTRNPLADPGLLGLSAGANASLAVVVAMIPSLNYSGIMLVCFVGAALGMLLVIGIGTIKKGGMSPFRIVLAGSAISAFLYAVADGIGLLFKTSKDVTMWTSGGLIGTNWEQVQSICPVIAAALLVAVAFSKPLTILSLNEEAAVGLGLRTAYVKAFLYIVIILLAGASVALVGNMAFVGLMIPHMVRAMFGTDYRAVLPMSAIWGAAFMLMADTLGRTIFAPYETPVVAIIAVLGLPFFLFVVRKGVKSLS